jgi:uncharacterized membrane protein
MGANRSQALGLTVFLIAFAFIAAGMAAGGNFLLILIGLVLVGLSSAVFLKAKPLEHREE